MNRDGGVYLCVQVTVLSTRGFKPHVLLPDTVVPVVTHTPVPNGISFPAGSGLRGFCCGHRLFYAFGIWLNLSWYGFKGKMQARYHPT